MDFCFVPFQRHLSQMGFTLRCRLYEYEIFHAYSISGTLKTFYEFIGRLTAEIKWAIFNTGIFS